MSMLRKLSKEARRKEEGVQEAGGAVQEVKGGVLEAEGGVEA